jgi:hypothetical protein
MAKSPPIPKEQRSFMGKDADPVEGKRDRRDERTTNLQSGQPGDGDANLEEQGRYGNIKQNTTHQGYQQDR